MHSSPWFFRVAFVIAIVAIKAILNIVSALYLRKRHDQYMKWLADGKNVESLQLSKNRTIELLKQAGVEDKKIPVSQPTGHGYFATFTAGAFHAYPTRAAIMASFMNDCFIEAIGVYQGRAIDAINPLYWLRLIVYLPTRLCIALGAKAESIPLKILQGLYWFIAAAVGAIFAFAKEEVLAWLQTLLG